MRDYYTKGSELAEKLTALGYDANMIDIDNIHSRYHNREGVIVNGALRDESFHYWSEITKLYDDLKEFNIVEKLREEGVEFDLKWVKYFPYERDHDKHWYDMDKVKTFIGTIGVHNLKEKLMEQGYDLSEEELSYVQKNCSHLTKFGDYSLQNIRIEDAIRYLNSPNDFNLKAKLKERGYDLEDSVLNKLKYSSFITDQQGQEPILIYDLEKLIEIIEGKKPKGKVKDMYQLIHGKPNDEANNDFNYFGDGLVDMFGKIEGNSQTRYPVVRWYTEKYNTIPDICSVGYMHIDDLLDDEDFKVLWTYKQLAKCEDNMREYSNNPRNLRVYEDKLQVEMVSEALLEVEDGMFIHILNGNYFRKEHSMQAYVTIYYKEGIHDPTEVVARMTEYYVMHEDSGTLSILYHNSRDFELHDFSIPEPKIEFDLNYNDGFEDVHEEIYEALRESDGKGLVLLYGAPGTGKTTYIRYLINKIVKNKIFVPPNLTEMLSDPGFIPFLMDNPNSILFVEDAENVLRSRDDGGNNQAVSNILNLTDGLLSDCLNIQIVATFNTDLKNIDPALVRKGRLITKYKFDTLEQDRVEKLAASLGVWLDDTENVTLADIYELKNKQQNTEKDEKA